MLLALFSTQFQIFKVKVNFGVLTDAIVVYHCETLDCDLLWTRDACECAKKTRKEKLLLPPKIDLKTNNVRIFV